MDCPALAKGLAEGEGKKVSVLEVGRKEHHFLCDTLDFPNVFLVYTSKPRGPLKSCFVFFVDRFPTSMAVRSLVTERDQQGDWAPCD